MNDLRYASRQLLKNPGFTAVAVLTLALGIGANTAIFQLLNAVRLKTLPVSKPQELIEVRIIGGNPGMGISDGANAEMTYPLWNNFKNSARHSPGFSLGAPGSPHRQRRGNADGEKPLDERRVFFRARVAPVCGRLFNADDDRRGAGPAAWSSVTPFGKANSAARTQPSAHH